VRRTSAVLVVAGVGLLLSAAPAPAADVLLLAHGRAVERDDPYLPAGPIDPVPSEPTARPAAARAGRRAPARAGRPSARSALARASAQRTRIALAALRDASAIDQGTYDTRLAQYDAAQRAMGKLKGVRCSELRGVLATVDAIAASGGLTPSRLPALFETLDRNRQWWTTGPLLSYGRRVGFPSSRLVWQHYPGQGIQIQWLATFGKANALFQAGKDADLAALLDEATGLATQRAGGIAWEYLFPFDHGSPPWVSALAQGTAIQALSRAAVRLAQPSRFESARQALGIFRTPPPEGVFEQTAAGAHYLQYSFAPRLHILNGFIQSLVGLHDFAALANDDPGRLLFAAGDAEARVEIPQFDTGAWSLYSSAGDWSDLGYHTLLRDFLRNLCTRLQRDAERTGQRLDAAVYCDTAQRFTDDLRTRPTVQLASRHARTGKPAKIEVVLSKPARVTVALIRAGKTAFSTTAQLQGGKRALRWPKAGRPALYQVRLSAVDLAGNAGSSGSTLRVRR
jgi:D-glucuronyl C5-epimerase C-terminus